MQHQPKSEQPKGGKPHKHHSKVPIVIVCVVVAVLATFGITYFGLHLYQLPFGTLELPWGDSSENAEVSNIAQSGYVASDGQTAYYVYAPNALAGNSKDSHPGIYACKLDGTGKHQIIVADEDVWISRVSVSDGNLVFLQKTSSNGSDSYSVHVTKTDGSDDTSVFDAPESTEVDGVYVYGSTIYAVVSTSSDIEIWQASTDSSQQATQACTLSVDPSLAKSVLVTRDKQVLYIKSNKQGDLPTYTICSQSVSGDGYTELYSDSSHLVGWVRPSGNRVYFSVVDRSTNTISVISTKSDGSDQKTLYTSEDACQNPSGSLVGQNYLLTYVKGGSTKTVCIPLDGSSTQTLNVPDQAAQSKIGEAYIVYDLDGKAAVFGAYNDGAKNAESLYVMDLDGSNATSLAD
ncbi:MAG: DUF5050 domain-containing protein [Atopobiaceae bacterium]